MNKVLDAFWRPSGENREIVFKDVTFENTMRGLNILYGNCGGSYEMDVCINGEVVAVAALTGIASYRTNETVHVCIPEIKPGTYTISFRTNQYPIIFKFIFTETTYFENVGHYEVPDYNFKETDNDLITATDELGRKLPNSDQCGPVKKRQVGLFYWTWRNQDVSWEPTSLEKILREHPEAEYDINHSSWKSIEYGRHTTLTEPRQIAVIPIGYADGFDRRFSNYGGEVVVRGKRCPVVGNVCMDQAMIDITSTDAQVGDAVEIFGDRLPIEELANKLGTITYEILTSVSRRVQRVYFHE